MKKIKLFLAITVLYMLNIAPAFAGWMTSVVDEDALYGIRPMLEIDSYGNPHIVYGCLGDLKYAYCNFGSAHPAWYVETVEKNVKQIPHGFTIDNDDILHIAYSINNQLGLRYGHYDGDTWTFKTANT